MRSWFESLVGPDYALPVMWIVAGLILLVLLLGLARLLRSLNGGTFVAGGRNRKARLAVMDAAAVDSRRRLVLVRRDDVEHLLLIGGPTDVVIEQDIRQLSRAPRPALQQESAAPPAPVPEPAPEPAREPVRPRLVSPPAAAAPAPAPVPARPPEPAPAMRPAPPSRDAGFFARPARSTAPAAAATAAATATTTAAAPATPAPLPPQPEDVSQATEPVAAEPRPEPELIVPAPAQRVGEPEPAPEPHPGPRLEREPEHAPSPEAYPSAPPPPSEEVEAPSFASSPPSRAGDVDDDLLRELEATLERGEQQSPKPKSEDAMLEDEMSKLLGELSGERR